MEDVVEDALLVAIRLAALAGELTRAAFGTQLSMVAKTSPLDVVTEIDQAAERLLVDGIRCSFPAHHVVSEESGPWGSASRWEWLIDPLDGTHNFAIGIPLYGLSMAVLHDGRVKAALVQDSHLNRHIAVSAGSLQIKGGIRAQRPSASGLLTVALQQGYAVDRSDEALAFLRNGLERAFARVLYTWSPSIDLILLACGALGGIVAYRCAGPEHEAAQFVAEQLGCTIHRISHASSAGSPYSYVIGWPDVADHLLSLVLGYIPKG